MTITSFIDQKKKKPTTLSTLNTIQKGPIRFKSNQLCFTLRTETLKQKVIQPTIILTILKLESRNMGIREPWAELEFDLGGNGPLNFLLFFLKNITSIYMGFYFSNFVI